MTYPKLERPLVKGIAPKRRDIIMKAGGVVGDEVLLQPVPNPYEGYSGLPVTGPTFVGREDILRHIENGWMGEVATPAPYPLRSSPHWQVVHPAQPGPRRGFNTILVYLDMQDAGWVDHTGQLLLDFAEAIHRKASEGRVGRPVSLPLGAGYADLGTARRSLNALLDRLDGQMAGRRLILAVDEYEIIEEGIAKGRIDPGIPTLPAL